MEAVTAATEPDRTRTTRPAGTVVEELFEQHARMVYGLCRLLLRNRMEAEDATQQTFLSAHRSIVNGAVPRDGAAWLAAIARRECHARLRRRTFETVSLAESHGTGAGDPAGVAERDE